MAKETSAWVELQSFRKVYIKVLRVVVRPETISQNGLRRDAVKQGFKVRKGHVGESTTKFD